MPIKLAEQTTGAHTYMRLRLPSGRIEEIDVYWRENGPHYVTSADHFPDNPLHPQGLREQIIQAFNDLF